MKAVKRSEFCKKDVAAVDKRLGSLSHGTTFEGTIETCRGVWFKAYEGAVLLIPNQNNPRNWPLSYPKSAGRVVVGYKKLNVTLVIEDE